MLEHGNLIPRVKRHNRLADRWQVLGPADDGLPLLQPLVLIPVEVVNERILFRSVLGAPRLLRLFNRGPGPGEHGIDRGKRITQTINVGILRLPYPSRSICHLDTPIRHPLPVSTR